MTAKELAQAVGVTEVNLSILNSEKAKAIRYSTLAAICSALNCQPGDIVKYRQN